MPIRIVLAEDDSALCYAIQRGLSAAGYSIEAYETTFLAWAAVSSGAVLDVLVTDVMFPVGQPSGLALARNARFHHAALPVIFLTGHPELFHQDGSRPDFLLTKPVEIEALIALVEKVVSDRLRQ